MIHCDGCKLQCSQHKVGRSIVSSESCESGGKALHLRQFLSNTKTGNRFLAKGTHEKAQEYKTSILYYLQLPWSYFLPVSGLGINKLILQYIPAICQALCEMFYKHYSIESLQQFFLITQKENWGSGWSSSGRVQLWNIFKSSILSTPCRLPQMPATAALSCPRFYSNGRMSSQQT